MARMKLKVKASSDKEHVVLQLYEDEKPLGYILFDGATAEKHIQDVGQSRAELGDPVTPELDPGAILDAIVDPSWRVNGERLPEGRHIAFRHPGLGWVSFVLPDESAAAIAEWLTKDLPVQSDK